MKTLFIIFTVLIASIGFNSARALSIQYDGVDINGEAATSILEVAQIEENGVIWLYWSGDGGPSIGSEDEVYISSIFFGSTKDITGFNAYENAFGVFDQQTGLLYVYGSVVHDYEAIDELGYVFHFAYLLQMRFDGVGHFILEKIYRSSYMSDWDDFANIWVSNIPLETVRYRLVP